MDIQHAEGIFKRLRWGQMVRPKVRCWAETGNRNALCSTAPVSLWNAASRFVPHPYMIQIDKPHNVYMLLSGLRNRYHILTELAEAVPEMVGRKSRRTRQTRPVFGENTYAIKSPTNSLSSLASVNAGSILSEIESFGTVRAPDPKTALDVRDTPPAGTISGRPLFTDEAKQRG